MKLDRRQFLEGLGAIAAWSQLASSPLALAAAAENIRPSPLTPIAQSIRSTCAHCVNFCGIDVQVLNGVIRAIYPDEARAEFYNKGICPKGVSGLFNTYNPYRIKKPLKRTNPKKGLDQDPGWVEISWEEAFSTITEKMKKIREDNPAKLIWQHGHGKYLIGDKFPKAFAKAYGTPNLVHRTTSCEAARHVADEITWGYHGFLPDVKNCRLLLNFGANYFEAEQWARWLDHSITDAKEDGLKVISIEPRLSNAGAKADHWVPIKPGTDIVLILGLANWLVQNKIIDKEFLAQYTNAPELVSTKGTLLKDNEGTALVWDTKTSSAKPFSTGVEPALQGTYTIGGKQYTTAFSQFSKEIKSIDQAYIEKITGIPEGRFTLITDLIKQHAMIGATVQVDGKPHRYRPIAVHTFRGLSAKQYGTQTWRSGLILQMMLGNIDAVGGINLHSVFKQPGYFDVSKAEYPPKRVDLQESIYFPHATHNVCQQVAYTVLDPKKYGLEYVPEMQIFYATNRPFSVSDAKVQFESLKHTYNVTIELVLSETAQMSDIVLPDLSYLESWHYSPTRYTPNSKHIAIRQPTTNAYNIEHDGYSILWELSKRLGINEKYVELINKNWGLEKHPLEQGKDYTSQECVEHIWLENGKGTDFEYAKKNGFSGEHLSATKTYFSGVEKQFKGAGSPKMKFYADQLLASYSKIEKTVKEHKIADFDLKLYELALLPLPNKQHAHPTPHLRGDSYPFYLITFKYMHRNQSGNTSTNPILNSLGNNSDENSILLNRQVGIDRKIKDRQWVEIETPVGKLKGRVQLTETIRPDTIGISYHYGQQSTGLPEYARKGVWINSILENHPDVVSGMNSFNDTKCRLITV